MHGSPPTDESLRSKLVRGPTPVRVELAEQHPVWADRYATRAAELLARGS